MTIAPDSVLRLVNPGLEVEGRSHSVHAPRSRPVTALLCPEDFEAAYVTDDTQRYQMGYCQSQRSDPWRGDYFPGVSITLPFAFNVPEPKR